MVSLHVCGSYTRNEIQGEMVLPNVQESSVRGSPSRTKATGENGTCWNDIQRVIVLLDMHDLHPKVVLCEELVAIWSLVVVA